MNDTVYTDLLLNGNLDLWSKNRVALQYGGSGTKEEKANPMYLCYTRHWYRVKLNDDPFGPSIDYVTEVRPNVTFEEALLWVACGVLP